MIALADRSGGQDRVIDVYTIQKKAGERVATQASFAAAIGVPVKTLRNWEQDRRHPTGPGRVLLAVIWCNRVAQHRPRDLYLHQQAIDTSTPSGKAMFQM